MIFNIYIKLKDFNVQIIKSSKPFKYEDYLKLNMFPTEL